MLQSACSKMVDFRTIVIGGLLSTLACLGQARVVERLDDGLARTPPMGWNSYNHYSCRPNESIILSNAQAVVDLGLADLGYQYVTTDCGWTVSDRLPNGSLTWNASIFPSGFPAMGQKIHDLGLKFGVYSDSGIQMCMTGLPNQTGSLSHEQQDAMTFASWGADMLKYDNCYSSAAHGYPDADYAPLLSPAPRYQTMLDSIKATGRAMLFAICEWGVDFPSAWAPAIGNTWRISNDITPVWPTIFRILNQAVPQTSYAGPGQWLDLDMLEVGNNIFDKAEEQTHFSLWSILKSPLVIGAALQDQYTSINHTSLAILKNKDVIALNQDSLGLAASFKRRSAAEDLWEVWAGPLSGNRTVAALINWAAETRYLTLDLPDIGLQSAASIKSLWKNSSTQNVLTSYTEEVPGHGTMLLEIGGSTLAGHYDAKSFATITGSTTMFNNIYASTSSSAYTVIINFSAKCAQDTTIGISTSTSSEPSTVTISASSTSITLPIALSAGNSNSISIASVTSISCLTVIPPTGTYYPCTAFTLAGPANITSCPAGLCSPVGTKIGHLTPDASASLAISAPASTATAPAASGKKLVEIDYTNNDVAFNTSWTNGTNARNLTISVNGITTRIEVPLSGRSSELFSVGKGWDDSARFAVLVDGFGQGKGAEGADELVIGNEGGEIGVQPEGAQFVGLRVLW